MPRRCWLLLVVALALPRSASAQTPGVEALAAHRARLGLEPSARDGIDGRGVKVALLDTGFRGYRAALGHGLPTHVLARSFRKDGDLEARDSTHGIRCARVIHALAPGAELLFANWEPDCPEAFLEAVRWARDQGARVLSCSVLMPGWSDGAGGGSVHARLDPLLDDVLLVASAGNTAQRHWAGPLAPDADGWHAWKPGMIDNRIHPWTQDPITVELYGPAPLPCEICFVDPLTQTRIAQQKLAPEALRATLRFTPPERGCCALRLRSPASVRTELHVIVQGGTLDISTLSGSIAFPADGRRVLTVGAIDAADQRLAYSACGTSTHPCKPDLVAPVPFPGFAPPFAGTSAAAPQAAALAALTLARHPTWTPARLADALRHAARDLAPPGPDCFTGHGLVRLPRE